MSTCLLIENPLQIRRCCGQELLLYALVEKEKLQAFISVLVLSQEKQPIMFGDVKYLDFAPQFQ